MFENLEPPKLIKLCNQLRIHLYERGEIQGEAMKDRQIKDYRKS